MAFFEHLLDLYLDAAPWLVLGLITAGLIKAWLPEDRLNRWLGGNGVWSVTKAALVGAPLPLCSCGVLPAALGLRRAGASRGATLSFMIATPETGPDSVAISYALLGPFMTVARPVAAILSAIFTGLLGIFLGRERQPTIPLTATCDGGSCCASVCDIEAAEPPSPPLRKGLWGLRYAFTDILDDLVIWLGIGLILAALVATWVPPMAIAEWGSGFTAKLLMLLVGVPMYVCATASTPIAAGLLLAGISPGTVLVFLLAGPATNIATIAVIRKEMGSATMAAYLIGISLASVSLGLVTDGLAYLWGIDIMAQLDTGGEGVPGWLAMISGGALLLFAIRPLRRYFLR